MNTYERKAIVRYGPKPIDFSIYKVSTDSITYISEASYIHENISIQAMLKHITDLLPGQPAYSHIQRSYAPFTYK